MFTKKIVSTKKMFYFYGEFSQSDDGVTILRFVTREVFRI